MRFIRTAIAPSANGPAPDPRRAGSRWLFVLVAVAGCADRPPSPLDGQGPVQSICDGYRFLEGPAWSTAAGSLVFTDFPNDRIHELRPNGDVVVWREPSGRANGLAFGSNGALWACEHESRRVTRTDRRTGSRPSVVAARFDGARLNSPNDIVLRADGNAYFTDPVYGLEGRVMQLDGNHVFRIVPGGRLEIAVRGDADTRPNGIQLSPDGATLYVSDTRTGGVDAFALDDTGRVGKRRRFAQTMGRPDGMAVDRAGNLYVTSTAGVEVFAPNGRRHGVIEIPQRASNCAFGDDDGRTLYVTARSALYRVRLRPPGRQ